MKKFLILFLSLAFVVAFIPKGFCAEKTGILLLEHGGNQAYNEGAEKLRDAVRASTGVPVELGYVCCVTWGVSGSMQYAVNKLEAQGVNKIVAIPCFNNKENAALLSRAAYVLGLGPKPQKPADREMMGEPIVFAKANASFYFSDGWLDSPLIADILLGRAKELSKNPKEETLFIIDHGATYEWEMPYYDKAIKALVEQVKKKSPYKRVIMNYFRDDAAKDIKEKQLNEIKAQLAEASKDSKVLIVWPMVQDIRSIQPGGKWVKLLEDYDFVYTSKGMVEHPNMVKWIKEAFEKGVASEQFVKSDPTRYAEKDKKEEAPAEEGSGHSHGSIM
ncbi:MAG: hypothetical protein A3H37_04600 [Candidatus Schekmanbacteria bacterium RIFCSPLOWO2_02_FULL_38_14]|nr:MAG: hypothetical protein A3H37_04600 [Candidatus Schekmanbacteria bacterium RIFCSPLOWO2_02_FULL_38_14]